MTDREMLELAAKAAGVEWSADEGHGLTIQDGLWIVWDPLTDDGDSQRLSVGLRIDIHHEHQDKLGWIVEAISQPDKQGVSICSMELHGADAAAATRLAVLKTAAEIGRRMHDE